jgi:hypothetical protein
MACGDPDPQRAWPDRDLERRAELHGFAVHTRVHGLGGPDLDGRRVPRPSRAAPGIVWWIEDEDAEPTAGQGRPGAGHQRSIQRVGVVGDEYDGWAMVLAARVVHEVQF